MTYMEKYQLWLQSVPEQSPIYRELQSLKGNDKELRERFAGDLSFALRAFVVLWGRVRIG